jgi:hypothetical protein
MILDLRVNKEDSYGAEKIFYFKFDIDITIGFQ